MANPAPQGTVVAGFVPKPEGRAAILAAVEEAGRRGARLLVVTSRGHRTLAYGTRLIPGSAAETQVDLAGVLAEVEDSGISVDVLDLDQAGDPADDLVTAARDSEAEVIVIGLRRRTPVGKLILGSSAQRILLDAPCPVLAVKA